jgi:hypothetical protein
MAPNKPGIRMEDLLGVSVRFPDGTTEHRSGLVKNQEGDVLVDTPSLDPRAEYSITQERLEFEPTVAEVSHNAWTNHASLLGLAPSTPPADIVTRRPKSTEVLSVCGVYVNGTPFRFEQNGVGPEKIQRPDVIKWLDRGSFLGLGEFGTFATTHDLPQYPAEAMKSLNGAFVLGEGQALTGIVSSGFVHKGKLVLLSTPVA